jgi:hypothetical protein
MVVFYLRAAAGSSSTDCTRLLRITLLCSGGLKTASKLPQNTGDDASFPVLVCILKAASLPARRALEDASIIEQSLRSELERARITAG